MTKRGLILVTLAAALLAGSLWLTFSPPGKESPKDGHAHEGEASHSDDGAAPAQEAHSKDAHAEDAHGKDEHGHAHEEEEASESTRIDPKAAQQAEILVEEAGPRTIRETANLSGRIILNPNTTAQVTARFPGIAREVRKSVGDSVAAGEVLATVESNESLQVYPIKAPRAGVVLARTINAGDMAGEAPIFTIADVSEVAAELHVFARDLSRITTGQRVLITSADGTETAEAVLVSQVPVAEAASQTVVARAALPNPKGVWRAGMTVRAAAILSEREVSVAVRSAAIQRLEGATVVFVQEGETYAARKVELGAADSDYTEIRSGLRAGERYVASNSFTVKADIGKAGAEHDH